MVHNLLVFVHILGLLISFAYSVLAQNAHDLYAFPESEIRLGKSPIALDAAIDLAKSDSKLYTLVANTFEKGALESPDNAPYLLCSMPVAEGKSESIEGIQSDSDSSKNALSVNRQRHLEEASRILDDMPCLYRAEHWWTYELCRKRHVRQFHAYQDNKQPVSEYYLGRYSPDIERKLLVSKESTESDRVSILETVHNGDVCDLMQRPRTVQVQYTCFPNYQERIASIRELATCQYLITVYTPRLCQLKAFMPQAPPAIKQVICQPALKSSQNDQFIAENPKSLPLASTLFANRMHASRDSAQPPDTPSKSKVPSDTLNGESVIKQALKLMNQALGSGDSSTGVFELQFNADGSMVNEAKIRKAVEKALSSRTEALKDESNNKVSDGDGDDTATEKAKVGEFLERLLGNAEEQAGSDTNTVEKPQSASKDSTSESRAMRQAKLSERLVKAMEEAETLLQGMPEGGILQVQQLARIFGNKQLEKQKTEVTAQNLATAKVTPTVLPPSVKLLREHLFSKLKRLNTPSATVEALPLPGEQQEDDESALPASTIDEL